MWDTNLYKQYITLHFGDVCQKNEVQQPERKNLKWSICAVKSWSQYLWLDGKET